MPKPINIMKQFRIALGLKIFLLGQKGLFVCLAWAFGSSQYSPQFLIHKPLVCTSIFAAFLSWQQDALPDRTMLHVSFPQHLQRNVKMAASLYAMKHIFMFQKL